MKIRRAALKALLPLLALLGAAAPSFGASSATLNIDVTITAPLSVSVNAVPSSTMSVTWNTAISNQELLADATSTIKNDTGGLTTKWALSTIANSLNTAGNSETWAVATATADAVTGLLNVGDDQFAVQAVFGSSRTLTCPGSGAADWNNGSAAPLTTSPVTYKSTMFSDLLLNNDGTPKPDVFVGAPDGRMFAGSQRALCWRIIAPKTTATRDTQNIQIVVTAQLP
ncbi:MAG: hypothetical protein HY077_19195 [Elusimicrobia bacterium]|nr:hypothetical protein [Elusimicrobiota bacterium]